MGNVLRVLGIVGASMVLGLAALGLALFTICGGMQTSDGAGVMAVCLVLMGGAVTAIVLLGRGLAASRSTTALGLAVPPAGAVAAPTAASAGVAGAVAPPPPAAPATTSTLGRTDVQALMGLRIALALHVLFALASLALNAANMTRYGSAVTIQLMARTVLGLLPPLAVLAAVSLRTPPAPLALDAAAAMSIASLLFRFGMVGFTGLFTSAFTRGDGLSFMLLWMAVYSMLEAAIAGLALHLRSRLGPFNVPMLVGAVLGFLLWDGLVQAAMQVLIALLY